MVVVLLAWGARGRQFESGLPDKKASIATGFFYVYKVDYQQYLSIK
jgi:hypothetical protein